MCKNNNAIVINYALIPNKMEIINDYNFTYICRFSLEPIIAFLSKYSNLPTYMFDIKCAIKL